MSIRQMVKVWEHEFDHPEQAIMLALADHADDDGGSIFPSMSRLAWKTGYAKRSVQNIMSGLRARGVLEIVSPATRYRPNEYRIVWSKAQEKAPYVRGADFAPLEVETEGFRDATAVKQGCNSGEAGVQTECGRGATQLTPGVQPSSPQGCNPAHPNHHRNNIEPSGEIATRKIAETSSPPRPPPQQNPDPQKTQAPDELVELVGRWDAEWLIERDFRFGQAQRVWGALLPELWERALAAPNRKDSDRAVFRFQDAAERRMSLGLDPSPQRFERIKPAEPYPVGSRVEHDQWGVNTVRFYRQDGGSLVLDEAGVTVPVSEVRPCPN